MIAKTISELVKEAESQGLLKGNNRKSLKWFAKKVRDYKTSNVELIKSQPPERYRSAGNIGIGRMVLFSYDPKNKRKMPYYDSLPCIFIINIYKDKNAFLGINLHYLPYKMRAVLLDELYKIETTSKMSMQRKLKVTWEVLKSFTHFNLVKPCVKMYLFSHVRSKLVQIPYQEWSAVAMLPVQGGFHKQSAARVWNDSIKKSRM